MMHLRAPGLPISVLVVDGYPDAAASLAQILTFEGFAARAALSAEAALAMSIAEPPDVVVVEPRMFGGGWGLARRLAEPDVGGRPFVVALTTDGTAAGREMATAIGVDQYFVKPEDPAVLVRSLRRFGQAGRGDITLVAASRDKPSGPGPVESGLS